MTTNVTTWANKRGTACDLFCYCTTIKIFPNWLYDTVTVLNFIKIFACLNSGDGILTALLLGSPSEQIYLITDLEFGSARIHHILNVNKMCPCTCI